jgi:hypothetical protein
MIKEINNINKKNLIRFILILLFILTCTLGFVLLLLVMIFCVMSILTDNIYYLIPLGIIFLSTIVWTIICFHAIYHTDNLKYFGNQESINNDITITNV